LQGVLSQHSVSHYILSIVYLLNETSARLNNNNNNNEEEEDSISNYNNSTNTTITRRSTNSTTRTTNTTTSTASDVSKRYGKWQGIVSNDTELSQHLHEQGRQGLEVFGYEPPLAFPPGLVLVRSGDGGRITSSSSSAAAAVAMTCGAYDSTVRATREVAATAAVKVVKSSVSKLLFHRRRSSS
jgi:hypothetical protein